MATLQARDVNDLFKQLAKVEPKDPLTQDMANDYAIGVVHLLRGLSWQDKKTVLQKAGRLLDASTRRG